ncbi:MAG TPA: ACP S-malonyltransferase [Longimicrobiales bacterium]|nr:ACP S-malonyltransferase [Longimicrobiales bacterium]
MVGLLFPGQGSQFPGMGRELAEAYPDAKRTFEEADDVLGFALSRVAWDGPEEALTATSNAQPAILTHSIAAYRVVEARLGPVGMAAGHSLGEFTAYVAAGALTFADGVRTVRRRGELMQQSGDERPGTMAALLGLDDDVVERVCREASADGGACVPANYNSPGQLVISGDVPAVERALELARAAGARRAVRLNVSGAFHSPLMEVAQAGLMAQLEAAAFTAPSFPVVSNVTAAPVREGAEARRLLVEQLTSPVRWTASMQAMLAAGVTRFCEVGPGNVLSGLLRRVDRSAGAVALGTAAEVAALGG